MSKPFALIKPYAEMVNDLFKVGKELGNEHGNRMHAAIGIAGEVKELQVAVNRKELIEECGDIEFYLIALELQFPGIDWSIINSPTAIPPEYLNLRACLNLFTDAAGDILDVIKKGWVYNKALDMHKLYQHHDDLRMALFKFYQIIGTSQQEVCYLNQMKLIGPNGRYPNGSYSDAAAQNRADKIILN